MLEVFWVCCSIFLVVASICLFMTCLMFTLEFKNILEICREFAKKKVVKSYEEPHTKSQVKIREYEEPPKKSFDSKVPEIDPSKFTNILKNPPRAPGGFGVVQKDDKNQGS